MWVKSMIGASWVHFIAANQLFCVLPTSLTQQFTYTRHILYDVMYIYFIAMSNFYRYSVYLQMIPTYCWKDTPAYTHKNKTNRKFIL